jgi:PBP superfamily domain
MKVWYILPLAICLWLSGCGAPYTSTSASTPEAIRIFYPASLKPWADKLADCAAGNPEAALYFLQQASTTANVIGNEINLTLGDSPIDNSLNAYQVGWEQVVVIVNQDNHLSKMPYDMLQQIFSGQVVNWEANTNQPIQVWTLPNSEPTRQVFEQALALNRLLAPEARLAPDPLAILQEVATDRNAVGFLPESYMNNYDSTDAKNVKIVQLDQSIEQALRQPVIALTRGEPKGSERNLINCLQSSSP